MLIGPKRLRSIVCRPGTGVCDRGVVSALESVAGTHCGRRSHQDRWRLSRVFVVSPWPVYAEIDVVCDMSDMFLY